MADNRTMAELLQAPTEGYEDAIVVPEIEANPILRSSIRVTQLCSTAFTGAGAGTGDVNLSRIRALT
ncbi:hypothetical protein Tco_0726066 [Tanacetum coccineum]|uniref:Reverse transcriptase domain-containing protein n=1 Tax=Tanacetum coccineum TaxID=301880 RepID=A0ABQ4YEL9_9ASTR